MLQRNLGVSMYAAHVKVPHLCAEVEKSWRTATIEKNLFKDAIHFEIKFFK